MGLNLNIGALSARAVDYNGDGWPDLLICGYTGGLRLFKNNQGHGFTDVSSVLGPSVNAVDALLVDVNHDSRLDLIVLTKTAVTLRLQNADGTFAKPTTILNLEDGVALAVGDVNGDNNPDIYVVCGRTGSANAPDHLLIGDATGGFTTHVYPADNHRLGRSRLPHRLQPLRPHRPSSSSTVQSPTPARSSSSPPSPRHRHARGRPGPHLSGAPSRWLRGPAGGRARR